MRHDAENHHRRTLRLPGYDYTQAGAYFVTVVARNRECLFGEVVDGEMRLNALGEIVRDEWLQSPTVRPDVDLDVFLVMPNHLHGIIVLTNHTVGATRRVAPTPGRPRGPIPGSIGAIVGQFKSAVTKRINAARGASGALLWQRNYYEHVIRTEDELNRIGQYILDNPACWAEDPENPVAERISQT